MYQLDRAGDALFSQPNPLILPEIHWGRNQIRRARVAAKRRRWGRPEVCPTLVSPPEMDVARPRGSGPPLEPASVDGKDAFHRVPDFARNKWDEVERVLSRFRSIERVKMSGGSLSFGFVVA